LHGLSCRRHEECAEAIAEAFSLSGSAVSRRFIRASAKVLKDVCRRRLEGYALVELILGCLVRAKCMKGTVRTVSRDGREDLMEAMRRKLKTPAGKKTYQKRICTVGPVFGNMQGDQGKIALGLGGLIKVKGEFLLRCLVNNIR
jgi:hypothetical protein